MCNVGLNDITSHKYVCFVHYILSFVHVFFVFGLGFSTFKQIK